MRRVGVGVAGFGIGFALAGAAQAQVGGSGFDWGLATYIFAMSAFGLILASRTESTESLTRTAASNLLHRRPHSVDDQGFNPSRHDTIKAMESLTGSVLRSTDEDGLVANWAGVVCETMQPSRLGIWIR